MFFCFKQKTAYEMRISDWSSDVCSSDLQKPARNHLRLVKPGDAEHHVGLAPRQAVEPRVGQQFDGDAGVNVYEFRQHRAQHMQAEPVGRGQAEVALEMLALARALALEAERSEERRVGKEGVSTCRSRWSRFH